MGHGPGSATEGADSHPGFRPLFEEVAPVRGQGQFEKTSGKTGAGFDEGKETPGSEIQSSEDPGLVKKDFPEI
jgi:hypothetical protein